MRTLLGQSLYLWLAVSVGLYVLFAWLRTRTGKVLINPLLCTVIILIAILALGHVPYASFYGGTHYLGFLVTPATVCLAVPLYEQWQVLRKNAVAILVALVAGVLAGLGTTALIAWATGLTHAEYASLLPKSVTLAFGAGLADKFGGQVPLTVGLITLTGLFGNIVASGYLRLIRVTDPAAVGLAIGNASHVMGTTRALELGPVQGAMSSLSVVVAGLLTVVFAPMFALR